MSGVARDVAAGAAKRRRSRRYRSIWRHELMAVKMATVTACHHSAQRLAATHAATQTDAAPALVVEYIAPAPAVHAAPAPVYVSTATTQAPVTEYVAPVLSDFLEPLVPVV